MEQANPISEWHKANARKRAPASQFLSFDTDTAEAAFTRELSDPVDPERTNERDCAWGLIGDTIDSLHTHYEANGKLRLCETLKPALLGEPAALPPTAYWPVNSPPLRPRWRVETSRMPQRLYRRTQREIPLQVSSPAGQKGHKTAARR